MTNKIYLFSCTLAFFLLTSCTAQVKTNLNADEFELGISQKENIQILDVRTATEYQSGHISNALLADWNNRDEFNRRVSFLDKQKPVYVYCLAGGRSASAASLLRKNGFENVYELSGGTNAWKAAKKPLEGKKTEKQMSLDSFNSTISGSKTVLVDFGATWCPPCKKMEPVLENLQKNNAGKFTLLKVDGGNDEEIMQAYNVTALPVFILFKEGKQVWRREGLVTEKEIADQF